MLASSDMKITNSRNFSPFAVPSVLTTADVPLASCQVPTSQALPFHSTGSVVSAARQLRVRPRTLRAKMAQCGLDAAAADYLRAVELGYDDMEQLSPYVFEVMSYGHEEAALPVLNKMIENGLRVKSAVNVQMPKCLE